MYAVIETGGKQIKVAKGDSIFVEKLDVKEGIPILDIAQSMGINNTFSLYTTIYPDTMSKRLTYTSSGSVYWPRNYTVVTSSNAYLSKIYQKLKEGKPILLGAKNSAGTQHWVVITGFIGGDKLTASGFTINDPGTKYRTNLQQFLNEYPTFYKYFYY